VTIDGRTRWLGLIGKPIAHSLSPQIQNHALSRMGENIVYLPLEIEAEDLPELIRLFPRIGGLGLNVTTPHKVPVGGIVRAGDHEVEQTGVTNTVLFLEGEAIGFATDGQGLWNWLASERIGPGPGGVVLLGFGATARSIAWQFGWRTPLTVVSRNPQEVERVLKGWVAEGWSGRSVCVSSWAEPPPARPVLVTGGLPVDVSKSAAVSAWLSAIDPGSTLVDLNYGAGRTVLRDRALDRGLVACDGTGLLVHQAALSLSVWLRVEVPVSLLQEGLEST